MEISVVFKMILILILILILAGLYVMVGMIVDHIMETDMNPIVISIWPVFIPVLAITGIGFIFYRMFEKRYESDTEGDGEDGEP